MRHGLMYALASFILGVGLASVFEVSGALISAAALLCALIVFLPRLRAQYAALIGIMCLSMAFLGIARVELADRAALPVPQLADEQRIVASGVITREPDVRETGTLYTVKLDSVNNNTAQVVVLARMPQRPAFAYGDRLTLSGEVAFPKEFETDAGRVFDYPGFLKKDGVHYLMVYPEVERTAQGQGSSIVAALFSLKRTWLAAVASVVPEPGAGLLGGLVVGAKRSLGEAWLERFQRVGLVHIVVLSGFNLTIVAYMLQALCRPFSPRVRIAVAAVGIVAFAVMVGASAAVLRATAMALLGLLAAYVARPYAVLRALLIAAALMVAHNPYVLLSDPGFQLSFVATAGLIILSPWWAARLGMVPAAFGMREIVAATLATQLAVLPLLVYQAGEVSIVALPLNLLVLPLVPLLMLIGFVTGCVALVSTMLAQPLAYIAHLLLMYVFAIVRAGAEFPYAVVSTPPVHALMVVLVYAAAAALWLFLMRRSAVRALSTH